LRAADLSLHTLLLAGALLGGAVGLAWAQDSEYTESAVIAPLASESLLLDAAVRGRLMVSVGEYGHILVSRDAGTTWKQAEVPTRATLTAVYLHDDKLGWAVGHDAEILHTRDGGTTWERQFRAPEQERPLLDVWFQDAQRGIAIGAYGLYLVTQDGGQSWDEQVFEAEDLVAEAGSAEDDLDDWEGGLDYHLNQIRQSADGRLYIAAEAGALYRSDDRGETWASLPSPYSGSFFGILPLKGDSVLAYGLRGHVFRSEDAGRSWAEIETATEAMLTDGFTLSDGSVVITGMAGVILIGPAGGASFDPRQLPEREGIATALAGESGQLILFGESGVRALASSEYR